MACKHQTAHATEDLLDGVAPVINLKPEHITAWLNPDQNSLQSMQGIMDDIQHSF